MIAASFLAIIGSMTLFILLYGHSRKIIIKILSDNFLYVIAITANQGRRVQSYNNNLPIFSYCRVLLKGQMATGISRLSLRIMLGFWLLMMIVLINAYTGTLTSQMTAPKFKPIPQSLEELAYMKKEYQITIMDNYFLANSFLVPFFIISLKLYANSIIFLFEYRGHHQGRTRYLETLCVNIQNSFLKNTQK